MVQIVQRHPKRYSKFTYGHPQGKNRSPTDSIESFLNLADKERQILQKNCRIPRYEIVVHILEPLDVPELKTTLSKIFDHFRQEDLVSVINVEPTDDGFGNPTDTVHSHILTDDERGVDFLRELGRAACLVAGLKDKATCNVAKNEFDVECRPLYDGYKYYDYFTKFDRPEELYLFVRGSRIQRFRTTGNWYIDANGKKDKTKKWNEIIQKTRARHSVATEQQGLNDGLDDHDENKIDDTSDFDLTFSDKLNCFMCQESNNDATDKDKTHDNQPTIMPKWCRTLTGHINHRQWNRKLHFNNLTKESASASYAVMHFETHDNFNATQSEAMTMTDVPIYNVTILPDTTKDILPIPKELSTKPCGFNPTPEQFADYLYEKYFCDNPVVIEPLPAGFEPADTPKLNASEKPMECFKAQVKSRAYFGKQMNSEQRQAWHKLVPAILLDYWDLGRSYDIDVIEQIVRQELYDLPVDKIELVKSTIEEYLPLLKLIYQRHSPFNLNHGFVPEVDIPKKSDGEYNADDEELAYAEIEGQDMPKKSTKKTTKKAVKKSTKTVESADSPKIKPVKEFRELFPPQSQKKNEELKQSILGRGVQEPLVVWEEENILIDGYHRYDICKKHKIPYKVRYISFKNKEEAKLWMWDNQIRRDLVTTKFQRIEIVLQFKNAIAERAKANQRAAGGAVPTKLEEAAEVDTYKILGEMSDVSHGTVRKAEWIRDNYKNGVVSEEDIAALRGNKAKISSIYDKYNPPKPKPSTAKPDADDTPDQVDHVEAQAISSPKPQEATEQSVMWQKWTKLGIHKKSDIVFQTLDRIMNHLTEEADREQFMNMVVGWASARKNKALHGVPQSIPDNSPPPTPPEQN